MIPNNFMVLFFLMRAPQIQITRLTIWKFQGCDQLVESPKKEPSVPESTEEKPLASTETQSLCGAKAEPTETTETPADAALQSGSKDEKSETEKKSGSSECGPQVQDGLPEQFVREKVWRQGRNSRQEGRGSGQVLEGWVVRQGQTKRAKRGEKVSNIFSSSIPNVRDKRFYSLILYLSKWYNRKWAP